MGRASSPVPGYKVTYPYGVRNARYAAGFHTGHDYAAPTGTPVVAVRDGVIAWSNSGGGAYGQWIGLRADNGRDYVYCHLSARSVRTGQRVKAGQRLGAVGATGRVTGPHLHFEDRPRGGGYGNVRRPSW
ncbi:M23 family metallopeptidase [Streptomyces sp. CC53]|uniref:M23 family metallopeptidase n=1 Tax=Streptomyces sp. CC53 TaxID=1906740 RepID=UPI0009A0DE70|nr:M23 family metallopeptidase [Streptomyces sp. CC53]